MTDDDALARALRDLDPARTRPDAPVPLAAERRLREILDRPTPSRRRRTRRPRLATSGLVAASIAVIVAVVVGVVWSPAPSASALTPDPLSYRTLSATAAQLADGAEDTLSDAAGPVAPERRSLSLGWYYSAMNATSGVFRREWVDLRWNADLSGSKLTTAAEATDAAGDRVPDVDPTPGTLVGELSFVQGQFSPVARDAPAPTPDAMAAAIRDTVGVEGDLGAGDAIIGARRLLDEWTLTNAQHAALLSLVTDAADARVLGETTDRLGRSVVAVAGVPATNPVHELVLLISTDTGRIVGMEDTLRQDDDSAGLPAGSVIEYIMWDADAWKNGMR